MLIKNKKGFYQVRELLLPGLVHGFSTKQFGNMSSKYGDRTTVDAARKKIADSIGVDIKNIAQMDLVHGTKVAVVRKPGLIAEVDGITTDTPQLPLWLLTGDCAPYILYDPKKKAIAAVHSGWMGTVGKIVPKTLSLMMINFDCKIKDILIGIGPSIEKCCYSNPRPNVEEFLPEWRGFIFNDSENSGRIDLNGFTVRELTELGIPKKNIFYSNYCTKDHSDEFFCSQEETAGVSRQGRFATVIQMI